MDQNPSSSRADRKTIEKNRRNEMKALYSKLNTLVPHQFQTREMVSLPDQLERATNYIRMLEAKLKKMEQKKNCLIGMSAATSRSEGRGHNDNLPKIDVRVTGSALEVVLISGLNCQFMFNGIIRLLHEQGAEVITASFSALENTVFHTIHSQIGVESAQNYGAARIANILKKFVYDCI